ncbi:MAG: HEAT repeat domain-containing protein [Myxococcales bacterium]|nr:HEAT repeat domain-containing protein [Myxococcales bacterium]
MHARKSIGGRLVLLASLVLFPACHADENDPAGQAKELSDPVRREYATGNLQRLYTSALGQHGGDRNAPPVKAIADASVEQLVKTYVDHPEDTQNGTHIIRLLAEMRDPRALPAFLQALKWRAEVNEEHAQTAAEVLPKIQWSEAQKSQIVQALGEALERVTGARGADNRMRNAFIRALGDFGDKAAVPALTTIALRQSEEQNFLFNRLAIEQLGKIGDPASVPTFLKGLVLFSPSNPGMRVNDVAAEALVRIGRPAFQPLVDMMEGKNDEVNALARAYIEAVRQRDPNAAKQMSPRMVTGAEASFALGALGFPEALEPLLKEAASSDYARRLNAAIATARLDVTGDRLEQVRALLQDVYKAAEEPAHKAQMLAVMRHLYNPDLIPFFMEVAKDTANEHPVVRLKAVEAVALLADKGEATALLAHIEGAGSDPYRDDYKKEHASSLQAAVECDTDLACWTKKLEDSDKAVVRKAVYMLGRLGRGKDAAIKALVSKLDSSDLQVRLAVVAALDRIAVKGSPEAVEVIDGLREKEQGQSIWNNFSREALPVQARLRNRSGK